MNIGTISSGAITSGLINGQTISSAANFTGAVTVAGNINLNDNLSVGKLAIGSFGSYLGRQSSDGSTVLQTGQAHLLLNPTGGNVGIGTTTPGAKLHVVGTGGANTFVVGTSVNGDGAVVIKPNYSAGVASIQGTNSQLTAVANLSINPEGGYVGVGTASPGAKLDVQATTGTLLNLLGTQASGDAAGATTYVAGNRYGTSFNILGFGNTHASRPSTLQIGAYNAEQNIAIMTDDSAAISAGTSAKGIFIKTGGNVGIGTTNPGTKLQVAGDIYSSVYGQSIWVTGNSFGRVQNNYYGIQDYFSMSSNYNRTSASAGTIDSVSLGTAEIMMYPNNGGPGVISFNTGAVNTAPSTAMTITGGNVGIGTGSPGARLEVLNTTASTITYPLLLTNADTLNNGAGVGINFDTYTSGTHTGRIENVRDTAGNYSMRFSSYINATALAEVMRISGTGNVGIGTTTPLGALVVQSAANVSSLNDAQIIAAANGSSPFGAAMRIDSRAISGGHDWMLFSSGGSAGEGQGKFIVSDNNTNRLTIDTSGNVGIGGTTAPEAKLEIAQTTGTTIGSNLGMWLSGNTSGAGSLVQIGLGYNGANAISPAVIGAVNTDNAGYTASDIFFATRSVTNPDTAPTERMRITKDGIVAIGTAAPATIGDGGTIQLLQVHNAGTTANAQSLLQLTTGATTNAGAVGAITWGATNATGEKRVAEITGTISTGSASSPSGQLDFYTNNAGTLGSKMTIQAGGNVGIGTTGPGQLLSVIDGSNTKSVQLRLGNNESTYNYDIGRSVSTGVLGFYGNQTGATGYSFGGVDGTRMTINTAGNVGIGTTNPAVKLDVAGALTTTGVATLNGVYVGQADSMGTITAEPGGTALRLKARAGNQPDLVVATSGNVGIGTTVPGAKLEVASGNVFFGDTSNGNMTQGLTINQLANDNEIFALKSSDTAHGMTDNGFETDTFASFLKAEPDSGGLRIIGQKDADGSAGHALWFRGFLGEAADTVKTTSAIGVLTLDSAVKTGTGQTVVGADGNLLAVRNFGTARFVFDAEGTLHAISDSATDTFGANGAVIMSGNVGIGTTGPGAKLEVLAGTTQSIQFGAVGTETVVGSNNSGYGIHLVGGIPATDYSATGGRIFLGGSTRGDGLVNGIQFLQNATEVMRIQNGGNVGIGTTGPESNLTVSGTLDTTPSVAGVHMGIISGYPGIDLKSGFASTGAFLDFGSTSGADYDFREIYDAPNGNLIFSASTTPNILTMRSSGNVGIGTTGPQNKLHILGSGTQVTDYPYTNGYLEIEGNDKTGTGGMLALMANDVPAVGNGHNQNRGGSITLGGRGYSGNGSLYSWAKIVGAKEGTGNADFAGYLSFLTSISGGSAIPEERMRITSTGNVGIGATAPGEKLELYGANGGGDIGIRFHEPGIVEYKMGIDDTTDYLYITNSNGATGIGANATGIVMTSTGNVGIGTTGPVQKLQVDTGVSTTGQGIPGTSGTTQKGILRLQPGGATYGETLDFGMNVSTTYAWIQATNSTNLATNYNLALNPNGGNVGIGTTGPTSKLHLYQDTNGGLNLLVQNPNTGASASSFTRYIAGTSDVYFGTDGSGSGTTRTNKAYVYNAGAGGVTLQAVNAAGVINFITSADAAANERMRIDAAGNVGIGTTNPFAGQFHVNKSATGALGGDIWITNSGTNAVGSTARLAFGPDATTDATPNAGIESITTNTTGNLSDLAFKIYDGSAYNEKMRIMSTGKVGIGTASPLTKLHVSAAGAGIVNAITLTNPSGVTANYGTAIAFGATSDALNSFGQIAVANRDTGNGSHSYMSFSTRLNDSLGEKMRINESGNVGIGTTAPGGILTVVADKAYNDGNGFRVQAATGQTSNLIFMGPSSSSDLASIQSYKEGASAGARPLLLNPMGGNVTIGSGGSWAPFQVKTTQANANQMFSVASPLVLADGVSLSSGNDGNTANKGMEFNASQYVFRVGNVGIGTGASPSYLLQVNGQPAANGYTAFTNYSDSRLKNNVTNLITDGSSALSKIVGLRPVTFNYNSLTGYSTSTQARRTSGFIAQELQQIFPEMVGTTTINGMEYFDTNLSDLPLYLINATQELNNITIQSSSTLSNFITTTNSNFSSASSSIITLSSEFSSSFSSASSSISSLSNLITFNQNQASTSISSLFTLVNNNQIEVSSTTSNIINLMNTNVSTLTTQISNITDRINLTNGKLNTLTLTSLGTVGIGNDGTSLGGELLRVSGRIRAQGFDIDSAADIAENFPASEAVDAGTVVAFSTNTVAWDAGGVSSNQQSASSNTNATSTASTTNSSLPTTSYQMSTVRKALSGYEAVGVVSTNSGIVLGSNTPNGVPVAFSGRVPVKVTTENGEVKRGDYLTVSSTMPGYAMKLTGEGRSIGRALSDYEAGKDRVLMLVENGNQKLDLAGRNATTTGMLTLGNIDLNANGVSIINIKSLASANGSWSIDENGRIVGKILCLDNVCINKDQLSQILSSSGVTGIVAGTSTTGGAISNQQTATSTDTTTSASTTVLPSSGTSSSAPTTSQSTASTTTDTTTTAPIVTATDPVIPPTITTDTATTTTTIDPTPVTSPAIDTTPIIAPIVDTTPLPTVDPTATP